MLLPQQSLLEGCDGMNVSKMRRLHSHTVMYNGLRDHRLHHWCPNNEGHHRWSNYYRRSRAAKISASKELGGDGYVAEWTAEETRVVVIAARLRTDRPGRQKHGQQRGERRHRLRHSRLLAATKIMGETLKTT
eukprot:6187011-Pleurochrysis_carterae.AAC.1